MKKKMKKKKIYIYVGVYQKNPTHPTLDIKYPNIL